MPPTCKAAGCHLFAGASGKCARHAGKAATKPAKPKTPAKPKPKKPAKPKPPARVTYADAPAVTKPKPKPKPKAPRAPAAAPAAEAKPKLKLSLQAANVQLYQRYGDDGPAVLQLRPGVYSWTTKHLACSKAWTTVREAFNNARRHFG